MGIGYTKAADTRLVYATTNIKKPQQPFQGFGARHKGDGPLREKQFTRVPLPVEFQGVPREAIATYTVLASYANNKTGLCWPKMETLAQTLGCSVRTVQRHLSALRDAGLVRYVDRRRVRGRFSSYTYQLVHFLRYATTGHRRQTAKRFPNKERTRPSINKGKTREEEAKRRREGYDWLFDD